MENEKAYYEKIKKTIEPLKEVVYFELLDENEVLKIEKEWKVTFKPIVREFLKNFGFTQDVITELKMDKEDMKDNLDWLREYKLNNYVPIKTKFTEESDIILALNNEDIEDNYLYEINLEEKDKSKMIKKGKRTFTEIIDKELSKIKVKNRCKNIDKIRTTEFNIKAPSIEKLLSVLEGSKTKQITKWRDKYYPENPFGAKVAKFEMFEKISLFFEKDEEGTSFRFEIDEPILLNKTESLIFKIKELLRKSNLEFEELDCDIIEIG